MTLCELLYGISLKTFEGDRETEVAGISFDSRKVKVAYLFVAIKGLTVDGHDYIDEAIKKGATVIVSEEKQKVKSGITYIQTDNTAKSLGILATNFYGNPSKKLKLVGITGTNGKTTCGHYPS